MLIVFIHSELQQVKKSGVEAGHTREGQTEEFSLGFEMGAHMREAVNINLGLLALKKCIEGELGLLFFLCVLVSDNNYVARSTEQPCVVHSLQGLQAHDVVERGPGRQQ